MLKDKEMRPEFSLLLSKKIELFEGLLNLSRKQSNVISDENWDELQSLLDKKEGLMKDVDELEKRLKPIIDEIVGEYGLDKKDWAGGLQEITELPGAVKEELKDLSKMIDELKEINDKNISEIKEKRMEANKGMMRIQEGRKINKGYNNSKRIYSTFIDKKG